MAGEAHCHPDQDHIDDIRRIVARPWWRSGWGTCGCLHPRHHEEGCRWRLDPDHRVQLAAATILDPFPAPRLAPDHECEVLGRIHTEPGYAARVAAWISSGRAGA
jgi:hypothetical protein